MNRIRQFAGQTIIYGLGHILSRIVFFLLITVYLTYRLKDSYQYGIYTDLYAIAALLLVLFSMRLDTAYFRFGSQEQYRTDAFASAFLPIVISAALLVFIGYLWAQPIAILLKYPDSPHYVLWFSIIMAFDILALLPFARLRLENKARLFVSYKVLNVVMTLVLVLFFLEVLPLYDTASLGFLPHLKHEIDYVFLANLISSIFIFLLLAFKMRKVSFAVSGSLCVKMLYYAFPLILVGVCGQFNQYFAVPLQKYFLGDNVIANISSGGIYGGSQKIASIFLLFTTAFNYAAEPFFFNNASHQSREELYGKICRLFTLIGGVLILTIYLGIDIFKYLIEKSFHEGLVVIPLLLIAYLFLGIYYNVSIWYKLSDKTMFGAIISFVGVIITTVISLYFLPRVGYIASAWAAVITFFVMLVLAFGLGQKFFPITYPVRKILINIAIILLLIIISYYTRIYMPYWLYLLIGACSWAGYLIYVWYAEKTEWLGIFTRR
jgi:O-antigen/teichoic acid export membrane protein